MSFKGYLVRERDPEQKLKRLLEGKSKASFTQFRKMEARPDHHPRLSGALRAYGGVSSPMSSEPVALEERVLRRKKRKKRDELASEKTWPQVTVEVLSSCDKSDEVNVSVVGTCVLLT